MDKLHRHRSGRYAWTPAQSGFATATVLMLVLISIVGGTLLLKRTRSQVAASSGYYQANTAALAAQSGLEAALAQLESDPAGSLAILNAYLADDAKAWLLGSAASAGARHEIAMDAGSQKYAARIAAYDPASGLIKLEGQGAGPGGSESKVYGVYQLKGVAPVVPALAKYVWFMAGEARNVDQQVDVWGDTYFGGGVHFNGGADGTVLHGTTKIAAGAGAQSEFDADITFASNAYVQTPFKAQGSGMWFGKDAGFEADLFLDREPKLTNPGQKAYFNGNISGGHSDFDVNGGQVFQGGSLDASRIKNAASIANTGAKIDIASKLGMLPGSEMEMSVDLSGIPAGKRYTVSGLGVGAWGNVTGTELSKAYAAAKASGKLHKGFLFLNVNTPLSFQSDPGGVLAGNFVFEISSQVNMNINLPASDPTSVCLFHVVSGGRVLGLGTNGLFRGYVNVTGTGSVVYQWGAGCEFRGAVHHISPASGFQLNGSTGPLKLTFDSGVFDALAPLGILIPPGGAVIPPSGGGTTTVTLTDAKIRPLLRARYY